MAQNKLSPRKKQAIFRYSQYALLAVIAVLIIALADWKTLSSQVFNLEVAQKQFPNVITVALKNTLIYTALGFAVGLSLGLILALMRISSMAGDNLCRNFPWHSGALGVLCLRLRHSPSLQNPVCR